MDRDGFCSYTIVAFLIRELLMNQSVLCSINLPNEITIAAMEAARRGEVEYFATPEELLKALDSAT